MTFATAACGLDVQKAGDDMVVVPAGSALIGCDETVDADCAEEERANRPIFVSAFEIDRTEVTQEAYRACVESGCCTPVSCNLGETIWDPDDHPSHPVVCVSWEQANRYCECRGLRLPTELEWEKAARGPDGRRFPWGDRPPDCALANHGACGGSVVDVATHPAGDSPYGASDMAGNVCEWVGDWYRPNRYEQMADTDPPSPPSGAERVIRDGNYQGPPELVRSTRRFALPPVDAHQPLGFRCAR